MKNQVSFKDPRIKLPKRKEIADLFESIPADIKYSDGTLPEVKFLLKLTCRRYFLELPEVFTLSIQDSSLCSYEEDLECLLGNRCIKYFPTVNNIKSTMPHSNLKVGVCKGARALDAQGTNSIINDGVFFKFLDIRRNYEFYIV